MARALMLAIAGAVALWLGWWAVTPSRPRAADASPAAFSAGRAMADVRVIGRAPHPVGSAEDNAIVAYLGGRLRRMGLAVALAPAPLDAAALAKIARQSGARPPSTVVGTNVIGTIAGRDPAKPAVLLMAHHDSVWGSPGAADDGFGVAAILEILRALRAGPPPERDVIALLTDGEEMGLSGARAFFAAAPLRHHVGIVLDLESRGGGGRALMFETGRGNGAAMALFGRTIPWPSANSLSVLVYRLLPNGTDLTPALESGAFGLNFAMAGRPELYHSPLATPERVDPASLQDLGQQALAMTRALAFAPALPARTPDVAFSDLWGSRLIVYPMATGWGLVTASLLLAAAAGFGLRRTGIGREVFRGLLAPGLIVLAALPLFLVNRLSGAGASANYYDRLAALPRLEVQTAALCLGTLLLAAAWPRVGRWGGWLALWSVLLTIALVVQIVAPAAGPFFQWPLLAASLAIAIAAWLDPALTRPHALAPVAALAAGGIGQLLGYAHLLFLMAGAARPEVFILLLLPIALLIWPLLHGLIPARATRWMVSGLAMLAIGLALTVRLDPLAPSVPVYDNDKP